MKILVTGATGYVGHSCADALSNAGHNVVRGTRRTVPGTNPTGTWLNHGDLTGQIEWPILLRGFDAVLHCAGMAGADGDRDRIALVNIQATAALAEGAATAGVRRLVFLSSVLAATAGDSESVNHYARSKRDAERRVEAIATRNGLEWVILRPPMVYGPECGGNFARLLAMVRRGVPLPLGCATAPKSFIAIGNLTSAVRLVLEHPAATNHTFYISDPGEISTSDFVQAIASSLGKKARLLPVPESFMRTVGRLAGKDREIRSLFDPLPVDNSLIQQTLGWQPQETVDDGIRNAIFAGQRATHTAPEKFPKVVYLATEDWFMASHFLPLLRQAHEMNFNPVVVARVRDHAAVLESEGARVVALNAERSSLNPFGLISNVHQLVKILRRERPDVVHCISLRMVVLGGVAARLARVRRVVLAPTGLGHLWVSGTVTTWAGRELTKLLLRTILRRPGTIFLIENSEDPQELGLGTDSADVVIVPGAGVDPSMFPLASEPTAPPVKVAVVARMTRAKGIDKAVAAARRAQRLGAPIELHLFGSVDTSNLGALSENELLELCRDPGVIWHGPSRAIAAVWREHHIAMLLSEREGLPRSLIEAAASGRPIIATDVTGCRDVVRDGVEGLLVPLGDVEAAAGALVRLSSDASLRTQLGAAAHQRFTSHFTEAIVRERIMQIYSRLLKSPGRDNL